VLTEACSANWPNASHRVLRACIEAAQALTDDAVGQIVIGDAALKLTRFMTPAPTRWSSGKIEAMPHYAGQSVGAVLAPLVGSPSVELFIRGVQSMEPCVQRLLLAA